jgi:hypothetical protein
VQDARRLHAATQGDDALLQARRLAVRIGHAAHVATNAERAARALQQHRAHIRIVCCPLRRMQQAQRELRTHRILALGAVHGDGQETVFQILQYDVGHGFLRFDCLAATMARLADPEQQQLLGA